MKKMLLHMTWSEVPIWSYALVAWIVLSWILMWPAKAYISTFAGNFLFGNWALGTVIFVIILMFFPYQYPRKK